MPPDRDAVIHEVMAALPAVPTIRAACRAVAVLLGRYVPGTVSVLLPTGDQLHTVTESPIRVGEPGETTGRFRDVTGAGPEGTRSPDQAAPPSGIALAAQVFAAGKPAVERDGRTEICVPVLDPSGRPTGVLLLSCDPDRLSWPDLGAGDDDSAVRHLSDLAERVAERLGARIAALGGPSAGSTPAERLLQHTLALSSAGTERELADAVGEAVWSVSGLHVIVPAGDPRWATPTVTDPATRHPAPPGAAVGPAWPDPTATATGRPGPPRDPALRELAARAHRIGAPVMSERDQLLLAVPVGPADRGGLLLAAGRPGDRPGAEELRMVELLAEQWWQSRERLRQLAVLQERAESDPLTGLRHQGSFGRRIVRTTPGRTAFLTIDVDDFKAVNDTYGHQAGDRALVDLARALQAALRTGDELYRVGGDEFVAVVEVTRPEEAVGIGERLTAAARGTGRTVSVGVAVRRDGEAPELTLRRADAALYEAKRQGRDRVCAAPA